MAEKFFQFGKSAFSRPFAAEQRIVLPSVNFRESRAEFRADLRRGIIARVGNALKNIQIMRKGGNDVGGKFSLERAPREHVVVE